VQNFQ